MKKFLPLLIMFILVFTGFIVGQLGWQSFAGGRPLKGDSEKDSQQTAQYARYEKHFLEGNFETIEGKKIEITKIKSPVVIYNFWASWCIPCMQEMPSLLALKNKFKDDELQVLAFNTDENDQLKNIQKTLLKFHIKNELNIIADKNITIANNFHIAALPVTIIFNRGKVVLVSDGPMDFTSAEMVEKMKVWIKG